MKILTTLLFSSFILASQAKADVPATHGMLLFGDRVTYASHLPMFHAPHNYQTILKLNLTNSPRSQALMAYAKSKLAGQTLFTIEPERMDLTKVIDGSKKSFQALIYDGHFERGGKVLGSVIATVEAIVYSSPLSAEMESKTGQEYLIFGGQGEFFGAHLIESKPSFDTIFAVDEPTKTFQGPCTRAGCPDPVEVPAQSSDLPLVLKGGDSAESGDILGALFGGFHTKVQEVIYLEAAELSE